ncbi:MAG TPA: hypothetical protein VFR59_04785, partial [Steroidobacteraceae bacterium]|nr:hypothetical protein [Steroidobacteraceae bacterium]
MSSTTERNAHAGIDLDRTDELPALDVSAYEAERGIPPGERIGSTDTWIAPALAPPVDEAALPADVAGEIAVAGFDTPSAIFDTIRALETNLRAKSELIAELEESLDRAERERGAAEKRAREREQALARIEH